MAGETIVRALRVVEYIGTREFIDRQVQNSSWTERPVRDGVIKAGWIGVTPGPVSPEVQVEEEARQMTERRREAAMSFVDAVAALESGAPAMSMSELIRHARGILVETQA
jgi:hypothetical protein